MLLYSHWRNVFGKLILALRYHRKAGVRATLLRTVVTVLEASTYHSGVHDAVEEDTPSLLSWLSVTSETDSHLGCRTEAREMLELVK